MKLVRSPLQAEPYTLVWRSMNGLDPTVTTPEKRSRLLEMLAAGGALLVGAWLLDRLVADRSSQLLVLSWILAATACAIALRSGQGKRHWWAWPAWMLAGSALCFLAGLLTLGD